MRCAYGHAASMRTCAAPMSMRTEASPPHQPLLLSIQHSIARLTRTHSRACGGRVRAGFMSVVNTTLICLTAKPLCMRGGGDVDAVNAEADAPDDASQATAVERHAPGSQTPDEALLRNQPVAQLVIRALDLFRDGRHPVPNVWTKAGNLRAMNTPNGVMGRCQKFITRESDPERVWPRSQWTARAQDIVGIAVEVHGYHAVVDTLATCLISEGVAEAVDYDTVQAGSSSTTAHSALTRALSPSHHRAGARTRTPHTRTPPTRPSPRTPPASRDHRHRRSHTLLPSPAPSPLSQGTSTRSHTRTHDDEHAHALA